MSKHVTPRKEAASSSHTSNQPSTSTHNTPRKEANTSVANTSNQLLDFSDFYDASVVNSLLDEPFEIDGTKLRTDKNYYGFDNNTGNNYIYPTNLQKRDYQYNISKQAIFKNTLVVLPTGLGKTFIAAVVMYNFFRWYPRGKIIFMAPTRPLVAQQVEACYKIMGIPPEDTVEMTGQRAKKFRSEIWRTKRVFYATPQLVQSDIASPDIDFPFSDIKLVVVDEAHKAQGKYAYTEVIQAIHSRNPLFRVLALSATPGRHIDDVCHVVKNLLISHIEIRWETSIDVSQYTFRKNIRTLVIPLGPHLTKIKDEFIQLMDPYVRYLLDQQVCSGKTFNSKLSSFFFHFQSSCACR
jgi:fanconi anemia group M protein